MTARKYTVSPAVGDFLVILMMSPDFALMALAIGSLEKILGSLSLVTVYLARTSFCSWAESTSCFGTISCSRMLTAMDSFPGITHCATVYVYTIVFICLFFRHQRNRSSRATRFHPAVHGAGQWVRVLLFAGKR